MRASLITGAAILITGVIIAFAEQRRMRRSKSFFGRHRYAGIVLAAVFCSATLSSFVRDYVYKVDSIRLNQQHYANTIWIREYRKALVGG